MKKVILIIGVLILSNLTYSQNSQNLVFLGPDIKVGVGQEVFFCPRTLLTDEEIRCCRYDFDGDGVFDLETNNLRLVEHTYNSPGEYVVNLILETQDGRRFRIWQKVVVEAGAGKQSVLEHHIPAQLRKTIPGDGVQTNYFLLCSAVDFDNLTRIRQKILERNLALPENVALLTVYGSGDSLATIENFLSALQNFASRVDEDDIFMVIVLQHGAGYFDQNSRNAVNRGYSSVAPIITEEGDPRNDKLDCDYKESDIKWWSLRNGGIYYPGDIGLDSLVLFMQRSPSHEMKIYGKKFVITVDSLVLANGKVFCDNDPWIEEIKYYASGDSNRNGFLDNNESLSGYSISDVAFEVVDDYNRDCDIDHDPANSLDHMFGVKTSGGWRVACCLNTGYTKNLPIDSMRVHGIDKDNKGLFDGMDFNSDGDVSDEVSFQERFYFTDGSLFDFEIAEAVFSQIKKAKWIFFSTGACFGGGIHENLSAKGVITHSFAPENNIARYMGDSFSRMWAYNFSSINISTSVRDIVNCFREIDKLNSQQMANDDGNREPSFLPLPSPTGDGIFSSHCNLVFNNATVEDEPRNLPLTPSLFQNYPNPANPTTCISYTLPQKAHVTLEIYNLLGQRVRTLVEGMKDAGLHTVVWDGRDEFGKTLPSGIYLYQLRAGQGKGQEDFVQVRKMMLMR
mgnify:CR=1 FL=1